MENEIKKYYVIKKKDGEFKLYKIDSKVAESREFSNLLHSKLKHLCPNCDNCYADDCSKVSDSKKNSICKYEYITDGLQVIDDTNDTLFFYVTTCKNYKVDKDRYKPTTKEELYELNRKKESIKIAYFDAETVEEADQIHLDLLNRKQLFYGETTSKRK